MLRAKSCSGCQLFRRPLGVAVVCITNVAERNMSLSNIKPGGTDQSCQSAYCFAWLTTQQYSQQADTTKKI